MKCMLHMLHYCVVAALAWMPLQALADAKKDMLQEMEPYLLPADHHLKAALDAIFMESRASFDSHSLQKAGFEILYNKKRSFIVVARHKSLPGYLLKIYLDCETRRKMHLAGWKWLVRRCEGAQNLRTAIQDIESVHFQVPEKWLYRLADNGTVKESRKVICQPVLLLVEDMQLVPAKQNVRAWRHDITKKHLHELYYILTHAKGSSYRPANLWLSKNGKFSFIDTEYPFRTPNMSKIGVNLSHTMRAYWRELKSKRNHKIPFA